MTTGRSPSRWDRATRATRGVRRLLFVLVAYASLRTVLADLAATGGLVTASGGVSWPFVALGLLVLALRGVALFVVPGGLIYLAVAKGLARGR